MMTLTKYKGLYLCFNQYGYYAVLKSDNRLRYFISKSSFKDTVTGRGHNGYYKDLKKLKEEISKLGDNITFDNLLKKGLL